MGLTAEREKVSVITTLFRLMIFPENCAESFLSSVSSTVSNYCRKLARQRELREKEK